MIKLTSQYLSLAPNMTPSTPSIWYIKPLILMTMWLMISCGHVQVKCKHQMVASIVNSDHEHQLHASLSTDINFNHQNWSWTLHPSLQWASIASTLHLILIMSIVTNNGYWIGLDHVNCSIKPNHIDDWLNKNVPLCLPEGHDVDKINYQSEKYLGKVMSTSRCSDWYII